MKFLLIAILILTPFFFFQAQTAPKDYTPVLDSVGKKIVAFKDITLIPVKEGFIVNGETPFKGYLLLPMFLEAYSKEEIDYLVAYNQLVLATHAVKVKK